MKDRIKDLKKIELHLHLDGSVNIETARELTKKSDEELRAMMVARDKCLDLTEYLTKFEVPCAIMQTKENLYKVARDLVCYLESENVIYAEVRFAPMFHISDGLSYDEVVEAVIDGLSGNTQVKTNLILCMMRGMDRENNLKTIEVASKYLGRGVCAIDLAGDECKYKLDEYLDLFAIAKEKGIPFTIHAGESGDALEIKKAIEVGAFRIGHGIHAIDDDEVLELIKERNVLLEICPTSNVQTNVVEEYSKHPIYELYKSGVRVCVNTDNVTVSNISISDEYRKLISCFDFSYDDFRKMNMNAIDSAFLSDEERLELIRKL